MTTAGSHHLTADTWRRYSEWPLAAAAVIFLVTFSIQVITDVPDSRAQIYDAIIWGTWVLFVVDYFVNLWLAERRLHWFVRNLHMAAILALPMLRPLRLMRLLSVLRLSHRVAGSLLRGRLLSYAFGSAILLCYAAALAVLDAEQNTPHANIKNIGDALWWAAVTIAGVGYGDYYPVTLVGRLVGVGLMIGGIALIAVVAGSLAAWMIEALGNRVVEAEEKTESDVMAELARVNAQLASLTALVAARESERVDAAPAAAVIHR
jgi:voltage-gated potassium channel